MRRLSGSLCMLLLNGVYCIAVMKTFVHSLNTLVMLKILIILNLYSSVFAQYYSCTNESSMNLIKRPIYEFSLKILDRVALETGGHFVFSPISAWLQLVTLAEGAEGGTKEEIFKVTGQHRKLCFRRKVRSVLNSMNDDLNLLCKRCNIIAVDRLYKVKDKFKEEAEQLSGVRVLSLDFDDPVSAAGETNMVVDDYMDGDVTEAVYPNDFKLTVLLSTDIAYFRGDWKYPFNRAYTTQQPFYSELGKDRLGVVNMMNQITYYNMADVPLLNARVLELPFSADDRVSLLVLLPQGSVSDIFYSLKAVRLTTIFHLFKQNGMQLVNVKIPRFKIITDVDTLPELIYDMGAKRLFYPDMADFSGISDYGVHTSLMSQISDIEVIEEGITARFFAEFLVTDNTTLEFNANRPFAYLIVDRKTEMILFAGSYNAPNLY